MTAIEHAQSPAHATTSATAKAHPTGTVRDPISVRLTIADGVRIGIGMFIVLPIMIFASVLLLFILGFNVFGE